MKQHLDRLVSQKGQIIAIQSLLTGLLNVTFPIMVLKLMLYNIHMQKKWGHYG